jgi:hypothetical protein
MRAGAAAGSASIAAAACLTPSRVMVAGAAEGGPDDAAGVIASACFARLAAEILPMIAPEFNSGSCRLNLISVRGAKDVLREASIRFSAADADVAPGRERTQVMGDQVGDATPASTAGPGVRRRARRPSTRLSVSRETSPAIAGASAAGFPGLFCEYYWEVHGSCHVPSC